MRCCCRKTWCPLLIAVMLLIGVGGWWVYDSGVLVLKRESVTFTSTDGVELAGEVIMKRSIDGQLPAYVAVHGSGRITRADERARARQAARDGFVVLIYDKRGVGESGGEYDYIRVADSERMLNLLADDAAAAWRMLRRREEVDPQRVGFIGGSQAGWIMPRAAEQCEGAAFIVAVSGPAVTYGEEIEYSRLTGDDEEGGMGPGELTEAEIAQRMDAFEGPHGYDPLPVLTELRVPSLWLLGGGDRSVPTSLSVRNFERIRGSGNDSATVIVYPGADHSLSGVDYVADVVQWLGERGIVRE